MTHRSAEKRAELIAGLGAVVLGIGIGALPALRLQRHAIVFLLSGVAIHGWGMFEKRRLDNRTNAAQPWWSEALYWICWLLLGALMVYALRIR